MIRISILGFTVAVLVVAVTTGLSGLVTFLAAGLYCSFLVWWIVSNPVVEDEDDEEGKEPASRISPPGNDGTQHSGNREGPD